MALDVTADRLASPLFVNQTNEGAFGRGPGEQTDRESRDLLPRGAGVRFTVAMQRSWCARRTVNPGLLALSILQDEVRRRLLDAWLNSGAGASLFAAEADKLLDFIAEQLPDASRELAVCRLEQLTLRAQSRASTFVAPDPALFDAQGALRRSPDAGMVLFQGSPELVLTVLLLQTPQPAVPYDMMALMVAPGSRPLCRIASSCEHELWMRLAVPATVATLIRDGIPRDAIESMLHVGALEYT